VALLTWRVPSHADITAVTCQQTANMLTPQCQHDGILPQLFTAWCSTPDMQMQVSSGRHHQAAARQDLLRHCSLADPEVVVVALAGLTSWAAVTCSGSIRQQAMQQQQQRVGSMSQVQGKHWWGQ
jgi:hypothetical protein